MKTSAIINNNKKIGIDFHGVINTNPTFFKQFIDCALKQNILIYIISGGPRNTIEKYLNENNISYSVLWCIYDFYEQTNQVKFFADGSFHVDDELWNSAKAKYCEKENICIHIDDSSIYARSFKTPYCKYDEKNHTCKIGDKLINLSSSPQEALDNILQNC